MQRDSRFSFSQTANRSPCGFFRCLLPGSLLFLHRLPPIFRCNTSSETPYSLARLAIDLPSAISVRRLSSFDSSRFFSICFTVFNCFASSARLALIARSSSSARSIASNKSALDKSCPAVSSFSSGSFFIVSVFRVRSRQDSPGLQCSAKNHHPRRAAFRGAFSRSKDNS